ncbi:MAG: lipid-A-disaccharide synthase N-terminal domain-containing protein [Psychroflexus maritimus]
MLSSWIVYSIGFVAQLLFSARTLYQWLSSEKKKTVVAPRYFWQISLFASFLLFAYGYLRNDFAIMLGQSLTYFIYIRNIQLEKQWHKFPLFARIFLFVFPLLIGLFYFNNNRIDTYYLFNKEEISTFLLILGVLSQLLFVSRFIYQWIYSERRKLSSLPKGFWVISLAGASLILLYGILRKDPVLIAGHSFGLFVYLRNLILLKK